MKYKKEFIITLLMIALIFFLRKINILQMENNLAKPSMMLLLIIISSFLAIVIQNNIDKNHANKNINYHNIDILKYICAILIIILHLRPFQNYSHNLDLVFNNIITRTCVPIFFLITGYFVSQKEKNNRTYPKEISTLAVARFKNAIFKPLNLRHGFGNFKAFERECNIFFFLLNPNKMSF